MSDTERRRHLRRHVLLAAELRSVGGRYRVEGMARDLSESGARVDLPPSALVPESVELTLPARGKKWPATVRWRRGTQIGLQFETQDVAPTPASLPASEAERRIAELEAENARLRRIIREFQSQMPGAI